ncbi:Swi5-domain-containing protein [Rickenella mellea]|uniref:Swi5-domain-containing protein n=1 Tax=Rickenella mellea TaxID=50990 RepID=A0A4Y7QGS4_9AGAM|nr:Swi5-domain-containing protein [Rickenella mellea]
MHASTSSKLTKDQKAHIESLETEIATLQAELGDEDAEKVVKKHIKLLHEYNEAKDATQILIGRLAAHKETTVKQLHVDYGLTADD